METTWRKFYLLWNGNEKIFLQISIFTPKLGSTLVGKEGVSIVISKYGQKNLPRTKRSIRFQNLLLK